MSYINSEYASPAKCAWEKGGEKGGIGERRNREIEAAVKGPFTGTYGGNW
jgi:hypothetical protein